MPSARALWDRRLLVVTKDVDEANYSCCGVRKMWKASNPEHGDKFGKIARYTVEWLMRQLGMDGTRRRRKRPKTAAVRTEECPDDLVERELSAQACPSRRPRTPWKSARTRLSRTSYGFTGDCRSIMPGWESIGCYTSRRRRRGIGQNSSPVRRGRSNPHAGSRCRILVIERQRLCMGPRSASRTMPDPAKMRRTITVKSSGTVRGTRPAHTHILASTTETPVRPVFYWSDRGFAQRGVGGI